MEQAIQKQRKGVYWSSGEEHKNDEEIDEGSASNGKTLQKMSEKREERKIREKW